MADLNVKMVQEFAQRVAAHGEGVHENFVVPEGEVVIKKNKLEDVAGDVPPSDAGQQQRRRTGLHGENVEASIDPKFSIFFNMRLLAEHPRKEEQQRPFGHQHPSSSVQLLLISSTAAKIG
ncbi:hypothetical protein TYRP_011557 [Tyrophagus putrescentiae]|nr:hypothetical protein TYRP_011557 [Tyrophagus putrescentiae]